MWGRGDRSVAGPCQQWFTRLLPTSRHVAMITGLSPAAKGDPARGVSAPLAASML